MTYLRNLLAGTVLVILAAGIVFVSRRAINSG